MASTPVPRRRGRRKSIAEMIMGGLGGGTPKATPKSVTPKGRATSPSGSVAGRTPVVSTPMSAPARGSRRTPTTSRKGPIAVVPMASRVPKSSSGAFGRARRHVAAACEQRRGPATAAAVMPPVGVHSHGGSRVAVRGGLRRVGSVVRASPAMRKYTGGDDGIPVAEKYLSTLIAEVKALPKKSRESFLRRFAAGVDMRPGATGAAANVRAVQPAEKVVETIQALPRTSSAIAAENAALARGKSFTTPRTASGSSSSMSGLTRTASDLPRVTSEISMGMAMGLRHGSGVGAELAEVLNLKNDGEAPLMPLSNPLPISIDVDTLLLNALPVSGGGLWGDLMKEDAVVRIGEKENALQRAINVADAKQAETARAAAAAEEPRTSAVSRTSSKLSEQSTGSRGSSRGHNAMSWAAMSKDVQLQRTERNRELTEVTASSELVLCMRKLVEYEAMTQKRQAQLESMLMEGKFDMARTEVLEACMSMLRDGSMVTQRLIETVVHVTSSSAKASHLVENLFSSIDDDGNGVLDVDELEAHTATLERAGIVLPGFGVRKLFNLWEADHEVGRGIDLDSFAAALSYLHVHLGDESAAPEVAAREELEHHMLVHKRDLMRSVFDALDASGLGSIQLESLARQLGELEPLGISLPPQSIMSMFEEWDVDHTGSISFHEFEMATTRMTTYSLQKSTMQDMTDRLRAHKADDFIVTSEVTDHLLDAEPHHFIKRGWLKKLPVLKVSERSKLKTTAKKKGASPQSSESARGLAPTIRSLRPTSPTNTGFSSAASGGKLYSGSGDANEYPKRRGGIQRWSKRFFTLTANGRFAYYKQITDAFDSGTTSTMMEASEGRKRRVSTSGGKALVARPRRKSLLEHAKSLVSSGSDAGGGAGDGQPLGLIQRVRRMSSAGGGSEADSSSLIQRVRRMSSGGQMAGAAGEPGGASLIQRVRRMSSGGSFRESGAASQLGIFEVTHRARISLGRSDPSEVDIVDGDGNVLTFKAENDEDAKEWKRALDGVVADAIGRQDALQKAALGTYWGDLIHRPEWVDDWVALVSSVKTETRRGLSHSAYTVEKRAELCGHTDQVFSSEWSHDGRYAVSGGVNNELIVHSLTAAPDSEVDGVPYFQPHRRIRLEKGWIASCRFSPTLRRIASGGIDESVSVSSWISEDTIETTMIGAHQGHVHCIRWAGVDEDTNLFSASADTTVAMWDVEHARLVHVFSGHSSDVLSLATTAEHPNAFLSASSDCMACFWDTRRCACAALASLHLSLSRARAPCARSISVPHPPYAALHFSAAASARRCSMTRTTATYKRCASTPARRSLPRQGQMALCGRTICASRTRTASSRRRTTTRTSGPP